MFMGKNTQTLVKLLPPGSSRSLNMNLFNIPPRQKDKVVIVMGATGTGKSKLSIDLATCFPSEIINSDKIQVYQGLEIITNKITKEEQHGVPHHLLGISSPHFDFPLTKFVDLATHAVESIISRDRLPIIVGGSNSYIEALITPKFRSKYECCFLWVDVAMPVLHSFVSDRVDKMVANGMVEEARKFFHPKNSDYSQGIRRAIGVPEFDQYFRHGALVDEKTRAKLLQQAISKVKENTCKLACCQLGKIHRLRKIKGWNICRLDATEVFRFDHGQLEAEEAWKKLVSGPSSMILRQFLYEHQVPSSATVSALRVPTALRRSNAAIAAATH